MSEKTICYVIGNNRMYDQQVIMSSSDDLYLWKVIVNGYYFEKYEEIRNLFPVVIKKIDLKEAKRMLDKKEYYNKPVLLNTRYEEFNDYQYSNGEIYDEYNYDTFVRSFQNNMY